MDPEGIRAFARRDTARLEEDKAEFRASRKQAVSPADVLALWDALRRHAQRLKPDWPASGGECREI